MISQEKTITPSQLIDEANLIWKKVVSSKIDPTDQAKRDQLLDTIRKAHPEFATSYPIVLRFMCQVNSYSPVAFTQYVKKISAKPWTNESEYLDSQADYLELLYKQTHSKYKKADVDAYKRAIRKTLQDEHDAIKQMSKQCEEETKLNQEQRRIKELKELEMFYTVNKEYMLTHDKIDLSVKCDPSTELPSSSMASTAISGVVRDVEYNRQPSRTVIPDATMGRLVTIPDLDYHRVPSSQLPPLKYELYHHVVVDQSSSDDDNNTANNTGNDTANMTTKVTASDLLL